MRTLTTISLLLIADPAAESRSDIFLISLRKVVLVELPCLIFDNFVLRWIICVEEVAENLSSIDLHRSYEVDAPTT